MEIRQLRHFVALAEEMHFGRTAERMCISQPALSSSIQKLEEEFQVRLFDRDSKSVRLTLSGELMLSYARETLYHADRTLGISRAMAEGRVGRLEVGFSSVVLNLGMDAIIQECRKKHPCIEIQMREITSQVQVEQLRAGRLDAGLVSFPLPPAGLQHIELFEDRFAVCLPENHPLAKCESIDIAQLRDERFILQSRESAPGIHDLLVGMCVDTGFYPKVAFESNHTISSVNLVARGGGVAFVLESLAQLGFRGAVFVPLDRQMPRRCGYFVWNEERVAPGIQTLIESAREIALRGPVS